MRDGVTNKEKRSIEHECLQDFAWQERKKRVCTDTGERDRKNDGAAYTTSCEALTNFFFCSNLT